MSTDKRSGDPAIRVTGGASPAQVAAVVAALAALSSGGDEAGDESASRRSLWNSHARAARPRLSPGPGAWRGSALPR